MKQFLDNYDTVIFDMDGVITSENTYWDVAALTVDELIKSKNYFGEHEYNTQAAEAQVKDIRNRIFANDALISALKNKGINSNWDLAYVTFLISVITGSDDGAKFLEYTDALDVEVLDDYTDLEFAAQKSGCVRCAGLRDSIVSCFQEWILGDAAFYKVYGKNPVQQGKTGLLYGEKPLFDISDIKAMLSELSQTKRLCIGTGRPESEIVPLLEKWGILSYFDSRGIGTYNAVSSAQERFSLTLSKPHPYIFLKALLGTDYPDEDIIGGNFDKTIVERALVVGDAGADLFAAGAMGADFCAVLTGVKKEAARGFFTEHNAGYILNSVCDLI